MTTLRIDRALPISPDSAHTVETLTDALKVASMATCTAHDLANQSEFFDFMPDDSDRRHVNRQNNVIHEAVHNLQHQSRLLDLAAPAEPVVHELFQHDPDYAVLELEVSKTPLVVVSGDNNHELQPSCEERLRRMTMDCLIAEEKLIDNVHPIIPYRNCPARIQDDPLSKIVSSVEAGEDSPPSAYIEEGAFDTGYYEIMPNGEERRPTWASTGGEWKPIVWSTPDGSTHTYTKEEHNPTVHYRPMYYGENHGMYRTLPSGDMELVYDWHMPVTTTQQDFQVGISMVVKWDNAEATYKITGGDFIRAIELAPADFLRQIIRSRSAPAFINKTGGLRPCTDQTILDGQFNVVRSGGSSEAVARSTLCKVIGSDKYRRYLQRGHISVRARSGLVYQIYPGSGHTNVYRDGELVEILCVVLTGGFPPTDSLIMRYLLILNDESDFRSLAISHKIPERHESEQRRHDTDGKSLVEIYREAQNRHSQVA